ncbi:hypothetical protein RSAG8_10985, partial [Rhizoctonia solani AG-8 WAC10335]
MRRIVLPVVPIQGVKRPLEDLISNTVSNLLPVNEQQFDSGAHAVTSRSAPKRDRTAN